MPISTIGQNGLNAPLSLTSPALGTPSAINLSNATALARAALPTGSVLQVQSVTTNANLNTSSTTYQVTGLTLTITPISSSSKFLLMVSGGMVDAENASSQGCLAFYRNGSTYLGSPNGRGVCQFYTSGSRIQAPASGMFYDTPATASAITYAVYIKSTNSTSVWFNTDGSYPALTVMEIAA